MKCKVLNPMCSYYARDGEVVYNLPRRRRSLRTPGVEVLQLPPTARVAKTTTLLCLVHASQNPKAASQGIARTPKQIMYTHTEATSTQCGGEAILRAGGTGTLCAGDASREEDTQPRERQERQDRGTNVGPLGRVRELPLGINLGER